MSEQDQGAAVDQETTPSPQEKPDSEAGPAVQPIQGDQGPPVAEQDPLTGTGGGDPNALYRQSPPPPQAQSGVPAIPENEGVEPQPEYAGSVGTGVTEQPTEPEGEQAPSQ